MKTCLLCGAMISPYPIHKEETGTCSDCLRDLGVRNVSPDPVDDDRPKIKGKHMIVKKSQAQTMMEKRKKELGRRFY